MEFPNVVEAESVTIDHSKFFHKLSEEYETGKNILVNL